MSAQGEEDSWGWELVPEQAESSGAAGTLIEDHVQGIQTNQPGVILGKKRYSHQKLTEKGSDLKAELTSSPSFQELEQAIGESLAMNLSPVNSSGDLSGNRSSNGSGIRRSGSKGKFGSGSKLSNSPATNSVVPMESNKPR